MAKVLIVYASDYGNTKKVAEAIAAGVKFGNGEAILKKADEAKAEDLTSADALILGTPVHMGTAASAVKKFIDTICSGLWMKNSLNGKVGAVFATASGFGASGGGAELTLLGLLANLAECGLIIVPLPKATAGYAKGGLHWGPVARSAGENMEQTGVQEASLEAAKHHGKHVARLAALLKGNNVFAA